MKTLRSYEAQIRRDALELGLSFDHVIFRKATPDEINEIAAFGLPNRYVHWVFGGQYKNLDMMDKTKQMYIFELVLNALPVVASLSTNNTLAENITVVAHVYGHADIFHNNKEYKKTDKQMVSRAAEHVEMIDRLRKRKGRKTIDDYLTAAMSVAKASMNTFQHPANRKKSLFYVLHDKAPKESHERQLFDIVKAESEYFDVVFRTQYLNEGWAHFVESELLRKHLSLDEWVDYAKCCTALPAQYQVGGALFASIKEKYGFAKCLEVRQYYDDLAFMQEFLTQDVVDSLHMGVKQGKETFRDVDVILKEFIDQKKTQNIPQIIVEDISRFGERLNLAYHEKGRKLDTEGRLPLYLKQVQLLWKGTVYLNTYDMGGKQNGLFQVDSAQRFRKV